MRHASVKQRPGGRPVNDLPDVIDAMNREVIPILGALRNAVNQLVRTITADDQLYASDHTVLVDATDGPVTLSLPSSAYAPRRVSVKKIDSTVNAVTIAAYGSEMIDYSSTLVLAAAGDSTDLVPDGTQWWIF